MCENAKCMLKITLVFSEIMNVIMLNEIQLFRSTKSVIISSALPLAPTIYYIAIFFFGLVRNCWKVLPSI